MKKKNQGSKFNKWNLPLYSGRQKLIHRASCVFISLSILLHIEILLQWDPIACSCPLAGIGSQCFVLCSWWIASFLGAELTVCCWSEIVSFIIYLLCIYYYLFLLLYLVMLLYRLLCDGSGIGVCTVMGVIMS